MLENERESAAKDGDGGGSNGIRKQESDIEIPSIGAAFCEKGGSDFSFFPAQDYIDYVRGVGCKTRGIEMVCREASHLACGLRTCNVATNFGATYS